MCVHRDYRILFCNKALEACCLFREADALVEWSGDEGVGSPDSCQVVLHAGCFGSMVGDLQLARHACHPAAEQVPAQNLGPSGLIQDTCPSLPAAPARTLRPHLPPQPDGVLQMPFYV